MFAIKRASTVAARRAVSKRTLASSSQGSVEGLAKKWVPPAVLVLGGLALLLPRNGGLSKTSEERTAMKTEWDSFTARSLRMNDDDDDDDEEEDEEEDDDE